MAAIFTLTSHLSILLFLIVSSSPLPAFSEEPFTLPRCHKEDRRALIEVFKSFGGVNQALLSIPCCEWSGVTCDPSSARVVGLAITDGGPPSTIPASISTLRSLKTLFLRKLPNLTGTIPPTITELKHLSLLDLSWNSLSGPIPPFLSQITSLTFLDLSFNKFSGSIPPSLSLLPNLGALHLDRNQLTGPIPESFGYFPKLSPPSLYLSHNNLSGDIPVSLGIPEWDAIDLSRNKLTGDASFLFGASKPTTQLDLSRNQLAFDLSQASFPVNLTLLDLNHNMIYGSIPAQINQVSGLVLFNVSYNRLCGEIPLGAVTAKFDEYSYDHNKCLCGKPLAPCSS